MPKHRRLRGAEIDDWLDFQLPTSHIVHDNAHSNRKASSNNTSFNSSSSTYGEHRQHQHQQHCHNKRDNEEFMYHDKHHSSRHTFSSWKHRSVDAITLRRVYMLQNFQFILWPDLTQAKPSQGLLEGQRKLMDSLRCGDKLISWDAVHSVVMRAPPESFECPICLQYPTAPRITECGHLFCLPCLLQYIASQKANNKPRSCPVCQSTIVLFALRPCILQPTLALGVGQEVCFDLYKRERESVILRRWDDPYWEEISEKEEIPLNNNNAKNTDINVRDDANVHDKACVNISSSSNSNSRHINNSSNDCNQDCSVRINGNDNIVENKNCKARKENSQTEMTATKTSEPCKLCKDEAGATSNSICNNKNAHSRDSLSLPLLGSKFGLQSRYVILTPECASNQRHLDATGVTERMQELEELPRPLTKFDMEVLWSMEQAWDEVSKEPRGIAHALLRSSPIMAPQHAVHDGQKGKVYELYVEGMNGQDYYLHMLTVKMLRYDAQLRQTTLPSRVHGKIQEIVTFYQDEATLQKFKAFNHIPLHGVVKLCILDLSNVVLPETLEHFSRSLRERENHRLEREKHDELLSTEDLEWKRYIEKYRVPSDVSPNVAPSSDFSLEAESLSNLMLPSVTSVYSDHGLPPNTLDTRQRATKKRTELNLLEVNMPNENDHASTSASTQEATTATTTTTIRTEQRVNRWSTGDAVRLLSRSAHSENEH